MECVLFSFGLTRAVAARAATSAAAATARGAGSALFYAVPNDEKQNQRNERQNQIVQYLHKNNPPI